MNIKLARVDKTVMDYNLLCLKKTFSFWIMILLELLWLNHITILRMILILHLSPLNNNSNTVLYNIKNSSIYFYPNHNPMFKSFRSVNQLLMSGMWKLRMTTGKYLQTIFEQILQCFIEKVVNYPFLWFSKHVIL